MEKILYDLTNSQKSIWLTEQFYQNTNINNICGTAIINQKLDFNILEKAIHLLVEKNDSFRLKFIKNNKNLKQYIEPYKEFPIEIVSLQSKEQISNLENEIVNKKFNIEKDFLFHCKIFKFPNNYGGFIVNVHHLIADSWTLGLLTKIIIHNYCSLLKNIQNLDNTEYSYVKHIEEEEKYFSSNKYIKDKTYWDSLFETIPNQISIPSSIKKRTSAFSCVASRENFHLNKAFVDKINIFCSKQKISAFNFFMSILAIYMYRITNTDDFVIGTPILNRSNFYDKNVTGMFVNTSPLRVQITENINFTDFVSQISSRSMELLRHQKYPYQSILEDIRKKDSSIPNLYNVLLSYQVTRTIEESEIPYSTRWIFNGNSNDDLDIQLYDVNNTGELDISYDYNIEKYTNKDIKQIHNRLMFLIDQILANKNVLLDDLEIVTPEEKKILLADFNNTSVNYDKNKTIVDLFEEQAEKTPDNIAVVFGDEKLTYKELCQKTNSLAYYLRKNQNIHKNDFIGIMVNRSLEMIISILATLKSGAAYIPIDPSYPEDRIDYMLKSSNAKVLLTRKNLENKINFHNKLFVDLDNKNLYTIENPNLQKINAPEDLAYVIFTSGSTGVPKGVMLKHKALSNLTNYCNNYIEYLKNPVYQAVVSITTVSFDIFIFETLISLQKGLKLVIANEKEQTDPISLNKLIEKNDIKIIQSTPSRMQLFVNNIKNIPNIKNLKYFTLAGEQLPLSLVNELYNLCNPVIYNGYGPSETTVFSTLTKMDNDVITIGKPLNNTQIHILDKNLKLVPIGTAGELYISGDGIGKGYLNNKELTNKSFIENPYLPGNIMYKTGDMGMYIEDGRIICLGRSDHQVKIRGLRIELEEIEDKIKELSFINSCVVVKKINSDSHEFLCAYYTSDSNEEYSLIRKHLEKYLPTYMVPSYFVKLENLPYTPNGKIDRKKLPEPKMEISHKEIIAPRNNFDSELIEILKELLNINSISIDDSFFELGGDSLHAINLSMHILDKFNVQIVSKDILETPIVQDLSDLISQKTNSPHKINIEPIEKSDFYKISSAQKRIYFSSQVAGNSSIIYNVPGSIIIDGKIDAKKLEKCLNILINRHESLRTFFELQKENIVQKIEENVNFNLEIENNSDFENLQSIFKQFIKPFDLSRAPLFRAKLIHFTNGKSAILVDMHHIISDGASLAIFTRELSKLYNDENLNNLNITYKDFAEYENKQFETDFFKEAENYWVHQFEGKLPVLNMPTTYSRPAIQTFEGKKVYSLVNAELKAKIDKLAKNLDITPYMLLLSIYYILLSKYTSQNDIIVGSPIIGRDILETQNLIGMFVNTLALRNKIDSNLSFKEFVFSIKENILNSYKYQSYPFDELVNKLDIKRDSSRNPLFDTMFIYQNNHYDSIKLGDLKAEYYLPDAEISKFDLSLEALPLDNEIKLCFEYSTKLFSENFIKNLSEHYLNILNVILENIDIKIEDICILSDQEKENILLGFNDTKSDYNKNKTISMLFEEQVEKTPNNIAVVFENEKLTFRELNEKANSLAYFLRNNGITRNSLVGIMVNRSLEMIISILATLKAGAAYIPIDPSYPQDRIDYMLKNSEAKILLTQKILENKIDFNNKLFVDLNNNNIYLLDNINLSNINTPEDLAYVIFTSGSTGLPKGVMLKHKALSNLTHYCNHYIEYLKKPTYQAIVSITTVSFDIFIFETLISLQKGLKLVIANEKEQTDPISLNNLIEKNNIKIIQATPSRMQLFVNNAKNIPVIKNLKYITLAGEQLPLSLVQKLHEFNITVYNGYGPSETTVFSTLTKMDNDFITIGKPLNNTQIYILDKNLNLVPIGIAGELYISGDGVGKGYLKNKELTDKSFIPNPYVPGSIMYKSGDMGMYTEDGRIICLGRSDYQVKIRGLRIELGEIEDKIKELSFINSCVVVKNIDSESHEFLCAYYTANTNTDPTEIRRYIEKFLPTYMVPQYFVHMDNLPYTPNGKIDRKKLPKPEVQISKKEIILPRNDIDSEIIEILKELLNISEISIDNSFFELGGDSLHAINLSMKIQDKFNVQIYSKDILENPIIQDLSDLISKKSNILDTKTIKKIPKAEFYKISSAQKRIYFASQVSGNSSTLYNIPNGIIVDGNLDSNKLENFLNILINRHESFRTSFEVIDENVVQVVKDHIDFKLEVENNSHFENLEKTFKEFIKPFDLSKAPLFRAKLIKFTNGKSAILVDIHHIISDGASLAILTQELSKLYNGENLSDLKITYKDFAEFENEQFKTDFFKEAEDYWVHQFEGEIPVLNMPTTYSRPAVQSFEGKKIYSLIIEKTKQKIDNIAKKLNITPYVLLLSVYYILLSKYTSQDDIVIGSPIVGRDVLETQNIVGMFVNTLALKNKVDNNLSFKDFVLNIKENLLNAYKYQTYPFDELVNKLDIRRDTSRNPLFDTMFIYQNNRYDFINFNGTNAEYYFPDAEISKFDISLEALPIDNEIKLSFEYSTKLFNEEFIQNLSNHYLNILDASLENIDAKIEDICMLSNQEKDKILYGFNDTKIDYDKNKTISQLFEEQVEKTPDNIAVVFGNQSLTFKELNEKTNSLAHFLRNNGVTRNSLVGIMINRSLEVIVAMLATIKAGGAYIPIDSTYPKDRINYMLSSSNAEILLTKKHLENNIDFKNKISIDLNNNEMYSHSTENLSAINKSDDLIYCIFTSGSTGLPKGVMIPHRVISNFTNYCNNYVDYLKNPVYDAIVSITTISFDLFVYEALISLQRGIKVIISNENEQTTSQLLNNLIEKNNATIIQSTPSIMQIFVNNIDNMPALKKLKYVILAGEQLPLNLVQKLHEFNITVYNGYGPSETHYCTLAKMNNNMITIGKPIYNSQMYILDKKFNPVPIGVTGDIYISGDCVGNGYLNNQELTNKSFIKNPFISDTMMYKSGDLGMYIDDGNILCLGRSDHQIKIRGLRIELEEIEALILKYPNINKATVVKQTVQNREFISAYFVANKRIVISELRKYLSHSLPRYMIPSYYTALEDLPYTPNGKVDKKALPLSTDILNISKEQYVAPKTKIQRQLVHIFEKILNTKPIGVNDNFFELGGDSLLAMNLNVELQKISTKITYQDIFHFPTVSELEEFIESDGKKTMFAKVENLPDDITKILKKSKKHEKMKTCSPKNILLTGSTGFLGIHILEELLKFKNTNIYCIVRDEPGVTSIAKLHQKLNYYFGNKYDDLINNRIFVITGNISKPGFGLNQEELLNLADSIDVIINSAANVAHYGKYNDFYNTNVVSVKYIIDFCNSFKKKLYHISTMGVAGRTLDTSYPKYNKKQKVIFDESSLYIGQDPENIYTFTKFEAEIQVLNAINKGLDAYILRMGNLMPRYRDGIFQENILDNAFINRLSSFLRIGIVPEYMMNNELEVTPVDYAAKSVCKLLTHRTNANRVFHLYNHRTISVSKCIKILKKLKFDIKVLSEKNFIEEIDEILKDEDTKNLLKIVIDDFDKNMHINYNTDMILKSDFTIKYLKRTFFHWPKITNRYAIRFINLLRRIL